MEAKEIQRRLRAWLRNLILGHPKPVPEPAVIRLVGSNKERFTFEGFDVESEVFTDRLIISVFQNGKRMLKGWVFHTSEGTFAFDHSISFYPNYKLRNYIRKYAESRLKELAEQQSKDLQ